MPKEMTNEEMFKQSAHRHIEENNVFLIIAGREDSDNISGGMLGSQRKLAAILASCLLQDEELRKLVEISLSIVKFANTDSTETLQ